MAAVQKLIIALSLCLFGFLAYVVPVAEKGRAAAGAVIDEYYNRYNAKDFGYIVSEMLTPAAREASGPEAFAAAYAKLGAARGRAKQSFKLVELSGRRFYYRFAAEYEKGPAVDSFFLVKGEDGRFRLDNVPNADFPCRGR